MTLLGCGLGLYTVAIIAAMGTRLGGEGAVAAAPSPPPDPRLEACREALDTADSIVAYSTQAARLANEALTALENSKPAYAAQATEDLSALQLPIEAEMRRFARASEVCQE